MLNILAAMLFVGLLAKHQTQLVIKMAYEN